MIASMLQWRRISDMPKSTEAKKEKKLTPNRPPRTIKPSKANAQEDKHDSRDARLALLEAEPKGSISWEKLKKELGI